MSDSNIVYVVSYLEAGEYESIVTVFDNPEAAQAMYNNLSEEHVPVWLDQCTVYKKYRVDGEWFGHD